MDRTPFVRLGRLAWPVLIAQLATIGMMAIDTVVVGRSNTDNLAALAVGQPDSPRLRGHRHGAAGLGHSGALAGRAHAMGPFVPHGLGHGHVVGCAVVAADVGPGQVLAVWRQRIAGKAL